MEVRAMTATIHRLPVRTPIRIVLEQPPVEAPIRIHAEAFMLTLRKHEDADRIPIHLFIALVDVLDAIVTRIERNG
jgi:hypothetical protein